MKEYEIQESWTKLFIASNLPDPINSHILNKAVYIFEDAPGVYRKSQSESGCLRFKECYF